MLVCTSGYPEYKEWIFYPRCLLSQVLVSGRKWRSVLRSVERGGSASSLKIASEIICVEKTLSKKTGHGLCSKSLWENRYICLQLAEKENKIWGNIKHLICEFWSGLLIGAKCQCGTELHADTRCALGKAGCWNIGCSVSVTHPWLPIVLLMAFFSISDGERAKEKPSSISTWRQCGGETSCRAILHPPRKPLPSWGIIWSNIDSLIPWFQLKLPYCEALLLPRLGFHMLEIGLHCARYCTTIAGKHSSSCSNTLNC